MGAYNHRCRPSPVWPALRLRSAQSLNLIRGVASPRLGDAGIGRREASIDLAEDRTDAGSHGRQNEDGRRTNQHQEKRILDNVLPLLITNEILDHNILQLSFLAIESDSTPISNQTYQKANIFWFELARSRLCSFTSVHHRLSISSFVSFKLRKFQAS